MGDQGNWIGIEARHIAALEAVAAEGSFRRAAARLGYVQSAISQQIAALERLVGQRVVERKRGGGRIELTEAGELVLLHGEAVLARLKAAQADVAALDGAGRQQLRLGISQSVGLRILPEVLARFRRDRPEVRVQLFEVATCEAPFEGVEQGRLDLAFVELPVPSGPFDVVELLEDPYVLVVRSNSPLAGRSIAVRELNDIPLIGHATCRGLWRVETQLRAVGVDPQIVVRSEVNATIQALARASIGAGILPALAVDPADEETATCALPDIPPRLHALIRHRDRTLTDAILSFISTARSVCATLAHELAA